MRADWHSWSQRTDKTQTSPNVRRTATCCKLTQTLVASDQRFAVRQSTLQSPCSSSPEQFTPLSVGRFFRVKRIPSLAQRSWPGLRPDHSSLSRYLLNVTRVILTRALAAKLWYFHIPILTEKSGDEMGRRAAVSSSFFNYNSGVSSENISL